MNTRKLYKLTRRGQYVKALAQALAGLSVFYGAIYALAKLSEYWLGHGG